MRLKFVLVGPNAGKTIELGSHKFVEGVTWATPSHRRDTTVEVMVRAMARYGAYPDGSEQLAHAQEAFLKLLLGQPVAQAPEYVAPEGPSEGSEPDFDNFENRRLMDAIQSLDPDETRLWNKNGLPLIPAIEAAYHQGGLNRRKVDEALPGWNRIRAMAAKSFRPTDMDLHLAQLVDKDVTRKEKGQFNV